MEQRNLSDGFEHFQQLSEDQVEAALKEGLLVVDTNVALNLYRWGGDAANDLINALGMAKDRLFLPHQVATEFWRNRRGVIGEAMGQADAFVNDLSNGTEPLKNRIREWRRRTSASEAEASGLIEKLETWLADAGSVATAHAGTTNFELDSNLDKLLTKITELFAGRVGAPGSEVERLADVDEGLKRFDDKVPPGFGDSDKKGDDRAGDYLVWIQALREAKARGSQYLVFVTDDSKKGDWFLVEKGQTVGPLPDLAREAVNVAGTRLVLLQPARYLTLAKKVLGATVSDSSISSIESFEELSGPASWTLDEIEIFMDALASAYPAHYTVVLEASHLGGRVSRERVYELAGFDDSRTLRGFTRPTATLARRLHQVGALPRFPMQDVLKSIYEDPTSYVLASHFEVPAEFVTWLDQASS